MKKSAILLISILFILPLYAGNSSVQVTTNDKSDPKPAEVNLKLNMGDTSYYQMGFTNSTVIDDTLVSLTALSLVPKFSLDSSMKTVSLSISDDSKTLRGYWLVFGTESFNINLKLSTLTGKNKGKTVEWSASWKDDSGKTVSIDGNGAPALFYSRDFKASGEIESAGSRMITFDISETKNLEDIMIDSYSGYITMEVAAI